jgi:hypothetical protein
MTTSKFDFDVITAREDRRDRKPWTPLFHTSIRRPAAAEPASHSPAPATQSAEQAPGELPQTREVP